MLRVPLRYGGVAVVRAGRDADRFGHYHDRGVLGRRYARAGSGLGVPRRHRDYSFRRDLHGHQRLYRRSVPRAVRLVGYGHWLYPRDPLVRLPRVRA